MSKCHIVGNHMQTSMRRVAFLYVFSGKSIYNLLFKASDHHQDICIVSIVFRGCDIKDRPMVSFQYRTDILHAREPLYSNSAVIAWCSQSTGAQNILFWFILIHSMSQYFTAFNFHDFFFSFGIIA